VSIDVKLNRRYQYNRLGKKIRIKGEMEGKKTTKPSNLDSDDSIPNRKISPTLQMEHLIQGCK
jgi:hypothetical protein